MTNAEVYWAMYRATYQVMCRAVNGAPGRTMGRAVFRAVDEAMGRTMGRIVRQAIDDEPPVPGLVLYLTEMVR